jgi:hypothetical protein
MPEQEMVWTVDNAPMRLTIPNTTAASGSNVILQVAMRGDVADGIGVEIARPSGGLLLDSYINYTTTLARYSLYFTAQASDGPLTLTLTAHDLSRGVQTLYLNDLSIILNDKAHIDLEGDLNLVDGTITASQMFTPWLEAPKIVGRDAGFDRNVTLLGNLAGATGA